VLESYPPSVAFQRDFVGPRWASWNALLQSLAFVQLTQGTDEILWDYPNISHSDYQWYYIGEEHLYHQ
jgi:hypothetical protein